MMMCDAWPVNGRGHRNWPFAAAMSTSIQPTEARSVAVGALSNQTPDRCSGASNQFMLLSITVTNINMFSFYEIILKHYSVINLSNSIVSEPYQY